MSHSTPLRRTTRGRYSRLGATLVATMAAVVAALAHFVAPAAAAPAPVAYTVSNTASSVTVSVLNGSVSTDGGKFSIRDSSGRSVFEMPLNYRNEYRQYPIDASVRGNAATLVPSKDVSRSVSVNASEVDAVRHKAAAPTTRQERDDAALARFNQALSAGLTVSTIVGTALGAVIGGVAGCVIASPLGGPFGCFLAGLPIGATIGGVIGTVIGGGGTLIVAGFQYLQTINSPFVPPAP